VVLVEILAAIINGATLIKLLQILNVLNQLIIALIHWELKSTKDAVRNTKLNLQLFCPKIHTFGILSVIKHRFNVKLQRNVIINYFVVF
jgi:hypothetical protein